MNHKEPLVSCMILTCGRSTVNDCINSIKSTITVPYEIVLVDNGRKCSIITQSYVNTYIGLKENIGVLARNYGKLAARGKYIMCVDDDVVMLSGWDEVFLGFIAEDSEVVGVGPEGHFVFEDLHNYNEKPGMPGRYVDVLTGYCWLHRNVPEALLPWDWYGLCEAAASWHDETQVQFQMREKGWRFKQTPMVCNHNSQRGEISKESWVDHDDKVKRIQRRFNARKLFLEKRI